MWTTAQTVLLPSITCMSTCLRNKCKRYRHGFTSACISSQQGTYECLQVPQCGSHSIFVATKFVASLTARKTDKEGCSRRQQPVDTKHPSGTPRVGCLQALCLQQRLTTADTCRQRRLCQTPAMLHPAVPRRMLSLSFGVRSPQLLR